MCSSVLDRYVNISDFGYACASPADAVMADDTDWRIGGHWPDAIDGLPNRLDQMVESTAVPLLDRRDLSSGPPHGLHKHLSQTRRDVA